MPGWRHGGIREKYKIMKLDENGTEVDPDPNAQYFVLRFDKDPHARVAVRAYMGSVDVENEELANDLRKKMKDTQAKFTASLLDPEDDEDEDE